MMHTRRLFVRARALADLATYRALRHGQTQAAGEHQTNVEYTYMDMI